MNSQTNRADGPTDATEERRRQTEICLLLDCQYRTCDRRRGSGAHGPRLQSRGVRMALLRRSAGEPVLSEIEPVSAGLAEVIRRARQECCPYVLLDRDAGILPDAPTYDW